jgi:uncharacterized small protein (DUF1192 family)
MGFLGQSKSKKFILAGVAVAIIAGGFFALKFMTSGGEEVKQEKGQTAARTAKKASPTFAEKKSAVGEKKENSSPLFEAMKALKDPFRMEDPAVAELQDKISSTKREIEYLKATLEEKKLRQEIRDIEMSMNEPTVSAPPHQQSPIEITGETVAEVNIEAGVMVKGILFSDEAKSALLISKDRKEWVNEGEYFAGWEIVKIYRDRVMLSKAGRDSVFFCDRSEVIKKEGL